MGFFLKLPTAEEIQNPHSQNTPQEAPKGESTVVAPAPAPATAPAPEAKTPPKTSPVSEWMTGD